jgi:hypothetical protein
MIIGAEAVLCNSFVSYYFTVVEKVHYTLVLDPALALQRVLISYERYSCDSYLSGSRTHRRRSRKTSYPCAVQVQRRRTGARAGVSLNEVCR